jgi:hypothetical protein
MPSTINVIPDPQTGQLRKNGATDANLILQTGGANAVTVNQLQNAVLNSSGAATIPRGTTAQRPASAVNGMIRYNSDYGGLLECYANGSWVAVTGSLT